MVSRERKRADDAKARLEDARKQIDALYAERQAERELDRAERQAVLNNLVQINNALTQLLAERQNGRASVEN